MISVHAGIDTPLNPLWQAAGDQFLAEFDEFLLVDGWLFIGEDEETHSVVFDQILNLIHDLFSGRARGNRARISTGYRRNR